MQTSHSQQKMRQQIEKTLLDHLSTMIELKSRNRGSKTNTEESTKNVFHPCESQSEFHMRITLGDKYKENDLKANVATMLSEFGNSFHEKNEQLIDHYVRLIENEKKAGPNYIYFYHAGNSQVAFIYDLYTAIYQHLQADKEWQALRGWNEPFAQFANVEDFIKHYANLRSDHEVYDKSPGYGDAAICANYFLFGNAPRPGECTIDYFISNRTSIPFDLSKVIRLIISKAEMPDALVQKLLQIYNEYYAGSRGVLYQISMPVADAEQLSYPSGAYGVLNPYKNTIKINEIFALLKQDLASGNPETIKIATDYVESLQTRLMVPPHIKINVEHISYSQLFNPHQEKKLIDFPQILTEMIYETIINIEKTALHPSITYQRILNELLKRNDVMQNQSISLRALKTAYDAGQVDTISEYIKKQPKLAKYVFGLSILDANVKVAACILEIYPELKNQNIDFSMQYFRNVPTNVFPLYEAIVDYSERPDEMMVTCYGKNWMYSMPIGMHHNRESLLMALRKIPENDRYKYAMKFLPKIKDSSQLIGDIAILLPINLRTKFILDFIDNVSLDEPLDGIFISIAFSRNLIDDHLKFLTHLLEEKSKRLPAVTVFFEMLTNIDSAAKLDLIKKYIALRPNCLCEPSPDLRHTETTFVTLLSETGGLRETSEKKAFVEYVLTLPNLPSEIVEQAKKWLLESENKNPKKYPNTKIVHTSALFQPVSDLTSPHPALIPRSCKFCC